MQAVKDAYENTLEKEIQLERLRAEFDALHEEFMRADQKREATFKAKLEAELEVAAGELEGLVTTYNTAKTAKETYESEEARLEGERAAMDAADSTATDAEKAAKDQEV